MSEIDISKLNKADVLVALFNDARPQGLGFLHYKPGGMSREGAEALLKQQDYFDYLEGRVMKVSLRGDSLDPGLYDRDHGPGAALRALQPLIQLTPAQAKT